LAAGAVLSLYLGGALAAIFVVGLAEARGRVLAVRPFIVLLGIGSLALSWAPMWWLKCAFGLLAGLGSGGAALILNTELARRSQGRALVSLMNGAYACGAVAGPVVIGLLASTGSVRPDVTLLVLGLAMLAVAAGGDWTLAAREAAPGARKVDGRNELWLLVSFGALYFAYAALENGIGGWEAVHLVAEGYSPAAAAGFTALFWVGIAVGRLVLPLIARGWSGPTVVGGTLVLSLAAQVGSVPAVGYAVCGVLLGPVFPTAFVWVTQVSARPRMTGAIALASTVAGSIVVPLGLGGVIELFGAVAIPGALMAIAALAILAALACRHLSRAEGIWGSSTVDRRGAVQAHP
jgi:MFS transporter, FHS family, glucose/mannose:H+ symporter